MSAEKMAWASSKKVKVSFYDPFSVYPKLQKELEAKLPLTNLHWKASEKSPLRSIPCLEVELVEEIPKNDSTSSVQKAIDTQMQKRVSKSFKEPSFLKRATTIMKNSSSTPEPEGLEPVEESKIELEDPEISETMITDLTNSINDSYLKVMFFEATNIDQYKSNVRPFIKEWFRQSVDSSKLPTDWLLVFYISQGGKDDYTTAFKYGLLDKIKLDFNNYKNGSFLDDSAPTTSSSGVNSANGLKILKIKHDFPTPAEYNQAWNSLMSSIKTGILSTFSERVNFFEYKIEKFLNSFDTAGGNGASNGAIDIPDRLYEHRLVAEMNIGLYFLMCENLGILYHDLSLYEDSLSQYENLEKIFEFYLKKHGSDKNLSIKFLNKIGFVSDFSKNPFYFNIYEKISLNSEILNNSSEKLLTTNGYEKIASEIFESLTNFNNPLFESLRKETLNNEISYFDLKNYFFLKQVTLINSIIFNNYSQLSSTPSVNSVYIFDLLKRLRNFVIQVSSEIQSFTGKEDQDQLNSFKLLEYCFTMVDNYLLFINEYFFKPPKEELSSDPSVPPLGNKSYAIYSKNKEINDTIGELRLIQRFFLVLLGRFFDYQIDNMYVDYFIVLKVDDFIAKSSETKMTFDHPLLTRIFGSFANYSRYYKHLTESAINNFNISDKPRNVDLLSIDIALLNYQVKNYNDSLKVLLKCPNFYNEQGWEYIGFYLLKIFINCLEKVLERDEALLKTEGLDQATAEKLTQSVHDNKMLLCTSYLDVLSTLIDSSNPASNRMTEISLSSNTNFVNNNLENIGKYLTNPADIDVMLTKLLKLKGEVDIEYDFSKIFKYHIKPFVISQEHNVYSVEIELDNLALFESEGTTDFFQFDSIELVLQGVSDPNDMVTFYLDRGSSEDTKFFLKKGKNTVFLNTNDIITGRFVVKDLKLQFGGVLLKKNHISTKREILEGGSEMDELAKGSFQGSIQGSIQGSTQGSTQESAPDSNPDSAAGGKVLGPETIHYDIKDIILIHPYITNVHFELRNPLSLNLNYKQFLLVINVGDFDFENGMIEFSTDSSTAFKLIGDDLKAFSKKRAINPDTGEFDFDDDDLFENGSVSAVEISSVAREVEDKDLTDDSVDLFYQIGKVSKNSILEITIPYTMNENKITGEHKNVVHLKTKLTYKSSNQTFSILSGEDLNTSLTIAVSVQDIFKSHKLFSKFAIGAADPSAPIRILDTDLLGNEKYETSSGFNPPSLIAFGEQPVSQFYQIVPKDENYITKENDSLRLVVHYRNLSEEIFKNVWEYFKKLYLVNKSNNTDKQHLSKYILLLKDYFFKLLRFDLTEFALFGKVKIRHFDILEFAELFTHFFPQDRSKYLMIFKNFIDLLKSSKLDLPIENFTYITSTARSDESIIAKEKEFNKSLTSINRELFINVPIPLVQVVHSIDLNFEPKSQFVVGEPIECHGKITSLVNWRGEKEDTSTGNGEKKKKRVLFQEPTEESGNEKFSIDFVGPQENWLISGKKKFQFEVDKNSLKGNEVNVSLYMIPLKIGKLVLPKIEVRPVHSHLNDDFSMEVDYKNASETVLVVPNLDRVTFAF